MDNLKLLRLNISDKLDDIEKLNNLSLSYDALENPNRLLEHYKEELKFFEEGKRSLARMIDTE